MSNASSSNQGRYGNLLKVSGMLDSYGGYVKIGGSLMMLAGVAIGVLGVTAIFAPGDLTQTPTSSG